MRNHAAHVLTLLLDFQKCIRWHSRSPPLKLIKVILHAGGSSNGKIRPQQTPDIEGLQGPKFEHTASRKFTSPDGVAVATGDHQRVPFDILKPCHAV